MPLEDLNKQLYDPNAKDLADRAHEQSKYDPVVSNNAGSPFAESEKWDQPQKGFTPSQKKKLWIAFAIFVVIALGIGGSAFYRWWLKDAFHQDRVAISFDGPKSADSTQPTKYVIHYKNDNRVTLKNSEIDLSYSENFQPNNNVNLKYISPNAGKIFLGDIPSKSEGSVELNGIFYAPKDSPIYIHGTLQFTPSNGTTQLTMESQIGVTIATAPVLLELTAPQQAVSGDNVEYVIDYKNLDIRRLSGMQIDVNFPPGFQMISSQPMPAQDSHWIVGNLEANQGGQIRIRGKLNGVSDENKNINIALGHIGTDGKMAIYNKAEKDTRMVTPILAVAQKLDGNDTGVINAGDVLKYVVTYKNTGQIGLRDAIITAEVKGAVLDYSKISAENGSYDGSKNLITWKASDVPSLANIEPNSTGSVRFSVPVKAVIPVSGKNDKNFVVTSLAKIDSPDIPTPIDSNKIIGTDSLELKLASKALFDTQGFYADSRLKNVGPIPLRVGAETTFTIHWKVSSVSNDLSDASVMSSLPSGIRWVGQTYPTGEKLAFDSRTNQLKWDIGDVPAGTGIIAPPREVDFQVGVTPQANQIGEIPVLVNKSVFSATDTFTNAPVNLEGPQKSTQLYEDNSVGSEGGKVSK